MTTKITKAEIDQLEAAHKRVAVVRGRPDPDGATPWEVVFRKPTRAEYKMFRANSHNPATIADAQEKLARACVVHPSKEAFDALLEDWPAIPEAASGAFSRLMGLAADEDSK